MSDSYPLAASLIGSVSVGASEGSTGIGPTFDFDETLATSIICHVIGNCSGLDAGKTVTFNVKTANDVQLGIGSWTLAGTLSLNANGLFSVSTTISPPAGPLQWLLTALTDSVASPTLSELTMVLEVVRSGSSRYPALLGAYQPASSISASTSETFGDLGNDPFCPIVDFGKLGPKFKVLVAATSASSGSGGRARVRIGGTYGVVDGVLVLDLPTSAAPFHTWAVSAVVDNIWSTPQPLKLTGMSGMEAIGPTLVVLPW